MAEFIDLLNDPPPAEWRTTRHCPTCSGVELRITSDDVLGGGWCSTECLKCGRQLRIDRIEGESWEDPEWAAGGEQ